MPRGPWAAAGSAWGEHRDTMVVYRVWQWGMATAAWLLPAPAWRCTPGTALGTRIRLGSRVPKSPSVARCDRPHGHAPSLHTDPGTRPFPHPQTPHELCRGPSCPARGGSIPPSVTVIPGGGPQGQPGMGARSTGAVRAAGRAPAIAFRLELPFVLPPPPVPPAPTRWIKAWLPKRIFPVPMREPAQGWGSCCSGAGVPKPHKHPPPPGTCCPAASGEAKARGKGWAGRNERWRGWDGAAGGPPFPVCTVILIQMGCPLKGTAVSRLRECHCRFLLPGGPRCPPGQASAAPGTTAGPSAEQWGASCARGADGAAFPGLPVQRGRNVPAAARMAGWAPGTGPWSCAGARGTVFCLTWTWATVEAPAQVGCGVEPQRSSPGHGAANWECPSLRTHSLPMGKVRHRQPRDRQCWSGRIQPAPPTGPFLVRRVLAPTLCPGARCSPWHTGLLTGSYLCPWGLWCRVSVWCPGCAVQVGGDQLGPAGSSRAHCCSWRRAAGACLLLRCRARRGRDLPAPSPSQGEAQARYEPVARRWPGPWLARSLHSIPAGLLCPGTWSLLPAASMGTTVPQARAPLTLC